MPDDPSATIPVRWIPDVPEPVSIVLAPVRTDTEEVHTLREPASSKQGTTPRKSNQRKANTVRTQRRKRRQWAELKEIEQRRDRGESWKDIRAIHGRAAHKSYQYWKSNGRPKHPTPEDFAKIHELKVKNSATWSEIAVDFGLTIDAIRRRYQRWKVKQGMDRCKPHDDTLNSPNAEEVAGSTECRTGTVETMIWTEQEQTDDDNDDNDDKDDNHNSRSDGRNLNNYCKDPAFSLLEEISRANEHSSQTTPHISSSCCDESAREHLAQPAPTISGRPDAAEPDLGTPPGVRVWDIEKELHLGMQWSMTLEMKYLTENVYILLEAISDRASRNGSVDAPTLAMYSMGVSLAKALDRLGWTELRSHFEVPFRERMSELCMDRMR